MPKVLVADPEIPDNIPSPLAEIIEGCLIKDYQQRWNAQQILNTLQPANQSYLPLQGKQLVNSYSTLPKKKYAGFERNICAFVIDFIPFYAMIYGVFAFFSSYSNPFFTIFSLLGSVIVFIIMGLYCALMESSPLQATLGQLACRIIVSDLQGKRISFQKASVRFFIMLFTLGIGFLMISSNKKKQGLHDKIAGCLVLVREFKNIP